MTRRVDSIVAPIAKDDAFIEAALEKASIPTLMTAMVHITGDPSILRGSIRPQKTIMGDVQGLMSQQDKGVVRQLALEILETYRDSGCQLPPPPAPDLIHEMMSFMVGEEVPDDYVP